MAQYHRNKWHNITEISTTTPFLLLAAWLFFRSSSRTYQWLLNSRLAGNYIRAFREQRAIPLHAKVISIFLLWLSISYSIFWVVSHTWIKVLLMGIAIGVSVHILSYNTLVKNRKE
ncbi:YbaN family protein [Williamwhitmania taraxaci]|uniref:YbaN family protein n=1 Tax=Williamwhitmania taraxaci TaxID=1640674 RepID=UPI00147DC80B|nr:YbaN family protein [Williamwhitmania taraxaci]